MLRHWIRVTVAASAMLVMLSCQRDQIFEPGATTPDHPEIAAMAVRVEVDVAEGTVRQLTPTSAGGPSRSILGSNEVAVTTTNLVRSVPVNGKVTVTFDAALTNRLTSASLVPSTFPSGAGLILFPFQVTQVVGGTAAQVAASTDWNGDGSAGSGALRNFFNDVGCPNANALADCFRWEQYPAPLGPGETTVAQRVGFTLPKAITSFQVLMVLTADISSDLPAVAAIGVTPPSYVMNDGLTASFTAVAYDAQNHPLSWPTLTWTTADNTALQFQNGSALVGVRTGSSQVVHGRKVGQTSFTVSSGGVSVVVPVDIQVNTVALVQLYTPDSSLTVGDQIQGDARVKDHSGQIIPGLLPTWSTTDPSVITVDQNGLISAMGGGTADVIATAGGASAAVTIIVAPATLGAMTGYVGAIWEGVPMLAGSPIEARLGGLTFTTTSDGIAHYTFPSLPIGNYKVTVQHSPACLEFTFDVTVTEGQTTTADFYLNCPAVVTGKVVEPFGNPLPLWLEVNFDNWPMTAQLLVPSDGNYTATFNPWFCSSSCRSGTVQVYLSPQPCVVLSGPLEILHFNYAGRYSLSDFVLDCRGRGNVVVDLTISGKPASGSIDFSLTGPAGPYSQVELLSVTSPGAHSFPPVPPGDYVIDVSLPSGCAVVGSKSLQVTLAVGATEHVPVAVDCP